MTVSTDANSALGDLYNSMFPAVNGRGVAYPYAIGSNPYHLIPYDRNGRFTGRKNHIEALKRFSESPGHTRVALHGLGGSGKTQIALEYVYQRVSVNNCHIFWVQGSGISKFIEGFKDVARLTGISLAKAKTDEEGFLMGVRRWLEDPKNGDWILVVDNADNEADFVSNNSPIAKFIPQGTHGRLIFTTRSLQVASRRGCETIEVGKMEEGEAVELFAKLWGCRENSGDKEEKAVALILHSVDHIPLAVVGSATFMIETATPPSVYWDIFQESEEQMKKLLFQQFCDTRREADATESILHTYFPTFDQIKQQMPLAADLLLLMASVDRHNIPEELLRKSGLKGIDDSIEFRRAIGKLLGLSLVTIVNCEGKTLYEVPHLIQLSLHAYITTEDRNHWRAVALQKISSLFPRARGYLTDRCRAKPRNRQAQTMAGPTRTRPDPKKPGPHKLFKSRD